MLFDSRTSRRFLKFLLACLSCTAVVNQIQAQTEPVDYVNPLIETTKSRYFFFNSACRPFGMVNLSPDNILEKEWNSGYKYQEPYVRGLTHIHDWGAGGLLVMPTTGGIDPTLGAEEWKSSFSHEKEKVHPGYHRVYLEKYATSVELTSTTHAGFHKYKFDKTGEARILTFLGGELGGGIMKNAFIKKINTKEIEGSVIQKTMVGDVQLFFVIQFDKPFKELNGWIGKRMTGAVRDTISGEQLGAYAVYDVKAGDSLQLRVGVSWCGIDQARLNLKSEITHWDFERVHRESRQDWNRWLGRIDVKGGTKEYRVKFYTDLWHALLGRRQIQDVNGKYPDYMSGTLKVKQVPLDRNGKPKFMHLSTDALWMTMWNLNILWGLAYPDVLESFVNSSMLYYKDGGHLPRGPVIGKESWIMTSSPVTELIVGAYMLGLRNYNIDSVYAALKKAHMPGSTMDYGGGFVQKYIDRGFVPERDPPEGWGGAGRTMEYVTQDWALAQLAKKLGKQGDAAYFLKRSKNWINLFDPTMGFIRPRNEDGSWLKSFDPLINANFGGFVEANTWQTTWMATHDVQGLVNAFGGKDKYCDKLNFAFEHASVDNFVGGYGSNYVNYSNQPGLAMAHLFNAAGKPWLSQYWVREVYNKTFSDVTPFGGYGGNDEDQGQMGGLSALMAIGLFDIKGGCDADPMYQITTPLFDTVTIHLNRAYYPGDKFTIITRNNKPTNRYIQSARLNGKPLEQCWFYQKDFKKGGVLELTASPDRNENWGVKNPPPSETIGLPNIQLSEIKYPSQVAAGDSLTVAYTVTNRGSLGGYYGKVFLDDEAIASDERILQPGETQQVNYKLRLFKSGAHQLVVDGKRHPVQIAYKKSSLNFFSTSITNIGENVHLETVVENNGSDVLDKKIAIQANGKSISEKSYHLEPGQQDTIRFSYTAPASGDYQIGINDVVYKELKIQLPVCKSEPGLLINYNFADTQTPLLDLSYNKNYPLPGKQPSLENFEGSQVLKFEKANHLKFADNDALNVKGSIAFSFVLYPTRWNGFARLLQKGEGDNQYMIYRNGDDNIEFKLTGLTNEKVSAKIPPVGKWTHLVCQYDQAAGKLQIWMNGKLVAEKESRGTVSSTRDPLYLGIKTARSGMEDAFEGMMREVRVWGRILKDGELQTKFNEF